MTHTFTVSRNDFVLFQKQVVRVVRKTVPRGLGFLLNMVVWLCIGLGVSTYLRLYETALEYRASVTLVGGLIALAAVAFILAQFVSGRSVQRHFLRDNGPLLSAQTISLDEHGVTVVTLHGLGSSRYAWAAFIGRTEDEQNVYLFLEPGYGIIVPKFVIFGPSEELVRRKVIEL